MDIPIRIRAATESDTDALLAVERDAFGGDIEAELVIALTAGRGFVPGMSLVADEGGRIIGHALFTRAEAGDARAALLAPLAVASDRQGSGVGTALVETGLRVAAALCFEVALVLGHPEYYPRFGFESAIPLGIEPPYPVEPAEAWMVRELAPGALDRARGVVRVADELMDPALWRE